MDILDRYLVPQAQIEIYKYNDWYSLCELYLKGIKCTISDQLWRPIYLKYFPRNKDPEKNYFMEFINEIPRRIDKYELLRAKYCHEVYKMQALGNIIEQFVQCDEYSLIKFLCNRGKYLICNPNDVWRSGLWIIKYTSEKLRNNEEIMRMAIQRQPDCIQYLGPELKDDEELICLAVQQDYHMLKYVDSGSVSNEKIMITALKQNWLAICYANKKLQNNLEVMRLAVAQNWTALKYSCADPKNDEETMRIAVTQNWQALEYASKRLREKLFYLTKNNISNN